MAQTIQENRSAAYSPLLPGDPIVSEVTSYLAMGQDIPGDVLVGLSECLRSAHATSSICNTEDFNLARATLIGVGVWDKVSPLVSDLG